MAFLCPPHLQEGGSPVARGATLVPEAAARASPPAPHCEREMMLLQRKRGRWGPGGPGATSPRAAPAGGGGGGAVRAEDRGEGGRRRLKMCWIVLAEPSMLSLPLLSCWGGRRGETEAPKRFAAFFSPGFFARYHPDLADAALFSHFPP